jgi:hypothetical protein
MVLEDEESMFWNEDVLKQVVHEYRNRFHVLNRSEETTWKLKNGKILKIAMNLLYWNKCKLCIAISEGEENERRKQSIRYKHKLC